jgi:hypothetical protein
MVSKQRGPVRSGRRFPARRWPRLIYLIANLEAPHVLLDLWAIRIASGREQALVQLMLAQTYRPISSESIARVWGWDSIYRRQNGGELLQILQLKVLLAAGKKRSWQESETGMSCLLIPE